jgi:hypothetical protein
MGVLYVHDGMIGIILFVSKLLVESSSLCSDDN